MPLQIDRLLAPYRHFLLAFLTIISIFLIWVEAIEKPQYCREKRHHRGKVSTFLWKIKRRPPSYFFGTIHVPYTEVWEYIHPKAKKAFRTSDTIFLELDLNNPRTLRNLAMCQLLPNGSYLKSQIPGDLYTKIEQRMGKLRSALKDWVEANEPKKNADSYAHKMFNNLAGNWQRKRPVWVMLLLNSLTTDGIKNRGLPVLDLYMAQKAISNSKFLGAIENATEQCRPLNLLNETHILHVLNQSLSMEDSYKSSLLTNHDRLSTKRLIEHYNCGSLDEKIFTEDSIQLPDVLHPQDSEKSKLALDEYFRQELIVGRNIRMAERVVKLLDSNPRRSFFFAFGAGHFLGRGDSVVDLVRSTGFVVEAVSPWRRRRHKKNNGKILNRRGKKRQNFQVASRNQKSIRKVQTTTTAGGTHNFNELWIRHKPFTPRPLTSDRKDNQKLMKVKIADQTQENFVVLQFTQVCVQCTKNSGHSVKSSLLFMVFMHSLF